MSFKQGKRKLIESLRADIEALSTSSDISALKERFDEFERQTNLTLNAYNDRLDALEGN